MILMYTMAYNAEKTLMRTYRSIKSQTIDNWVWYLIDNGSTDSTGTRLNGIALQDSRIIPRKNKKNHIWEPGNRLPEVILNSKDYDYLCTLDADDEYAPDFLEKMIAFMEKHHLEVAACGHDFINAETNKISGVRKLDQNLILEGTAFEQYFPVYHQFMRTIWCKVYRLSLLHKCTLEHTSKVSYGADTLFTMEAFRHAKRVGILAESLHKYYLSPKSVSHQLDAKRIVSDQILHEVAVDYLLDYGPISPRNQEFLYHVYFNAIRDTLRVVLNAQIPPTEKMRSLQEIVFCKYTQELIRLNYLKIQNDLSELRLSVVRWLLAQKDCRREEGARIAAEIIEALYRDLSQALNQDDLIYIIIKVPELIECLLKKDYDRILNRIRAWFKRHDADVPALTKLEIASCYALSKPDEEIFDLFIEIRNSRPQASAALNINSQICKLIEEYPLLKNMSADLVSTYSSAIRWVIKENYSQALDAFVSVQNVEINDNDSEGYILFGQNLSAAAENADAYIYFKKIWISYLLDCSRTEEARKELDEFEQLLPEDEDFMALRERYINR